MSHVVAIETEIRDLAALRAACEELGLTFNEGKTSYNWWGRHVGDFPLPAGLSAEQLGYCDHAISVPDTEYEIGLIQDSISGSYRLVFDFFGTGEKIINKLGRRCEKLIQMYGVRKTTMEAERRGFQADRETQADGSVKVFITKRV